MGTSVKHHYSNSKTGCLMIQTRYLFADGHIAHIFDIGRNCLHCIRKKTFYRAICR